MSHLQQARGMNYRVTITTAKLDAEGIKYSAAMELLQPVMNIINQVTGDVNAIFCGDDGGGNNGVPPLAPRTLGISGGTASTMAQQATTFLEGVNAPNAVTTSASLHWKMMGVNTTQQNAVVGGNGV